MEPVSILEQVNLLRLKRSEFTMLASDLDSQASLNRLDQAITKRLQELRYTSPDVEETVFLFGLNMRRLYEQRSDKKGRIYLQQLDGVDAAIRFFFSAGFLRKDFSDTYQEWKRSKEDALKRFQASKSPSPLSPDFPDQVEAALKTSLSKA